MFLFSKKITGVSVRVCVCVCVINKYFIPPVCADVAEDSRGLVSVGKQAANRQHSLIKIKGKQPNSLLFVAVRNLMRIS